MKNMLTSFRNLRLSTRMLIQIGCVTLLVFIGMIAVIAQVTGAMAEKNALAYVEELGERYGTEVQMTVEEAFDTASLEAETLRAMMELDLHNRDLFIKNAELFLKAKTKLSGCWCIFEPNAFDGKDADYKNLYERNKSGQFAPYWYRDGDSITMTMCGEDELKDDNINGYYRIPRETGKSYITPPTSYMIDGKPILMTSICYPIHYNGKNIGVAGADFYMDALSDLVGTIHPYGTGYAFMLTDEGIVTAHSNSDLLGKSFTEGYKDEALVSALQKALKSDTTTKIDATIGSDESLLIAIPIDFEDCDINWYLIVSVPKKQVYAEAGAVVFRTMLSGVLAFLLLLITVYFLARSIAKPLVNLTDTAKQISAGNFDMELATTRRDEVGQLTGAFDNVVQTLRAIQQQFADAATAAKSGDLSFRADATAFDGGFGDIVNVVNNVLNNIAAPLKETISVMQKVAANDLTSRVNEQVQGDYLKLAQSVNAAVQQLVLIQDLMGHIALGDLSDMDHLKALGKRSEADQIIPAAIQMMEALNSLVADAHLLTDAGLNGNLSVRADVDQHNGVYQRIIEGVNQTMDILVERLRTAGSVLDKIAHGDVLEEITEELKGDYNINKQNVNTCVKVLNGLQEEIRQLVQAGVDGRLTVRVDAEAYEGGWKGIVQGLNQIMETVVTPLDEAGSVLRQAADGNLSVRMSGDYKGQLLELRNHMNDTLGSLDDALRLVAESAGEVRSGSDQINDASQALSQGATEQASALEEISSSMQQVASQTKTNAENASLANNLSNAARTSAEEGSQQMGDMVHAMTAINDSSQQIAKIIKVIDDIAFQTNLLALNAAVEAARAGVHGKGFAVVADEVRNLAGRSAKAARETAELIEKSGDKVSTGLTMAEQTSKSFAGIVGEIVKVTDLVGEIAAASSEQAEGVSQINLGLQQVDQVTQQNTAAAEETASASTELKGQAEVLLNLIQKFSLSRRTSKRLESPQKRINKTSEKRTNINMAPASKKSGWGESSSSVNPDEVINLDDNEFGRF